MGPLQVETPSQRGSRTSFRAEAMMWVTHQTTTLNSGAIGAGMAAIAPATGPLCRGPDGNPERITQGCRKSFVLPNVINQLIQHPFFSECQLGNCLFRNALPCFLNHSGNFR